MALAKREGIRALVEGALDAIEFDQGKGFVSDGLSVSRTRKEVFDALRFHLRHKKKVVKALETFLSKHGEQ